MSNHKLDTGLDFISRLRKLGQILGYHVELELPIGKNAKAVDVAWFREANQKFPLFIFEVESNVTNAATYNPLKVFSERNEAFEKPLFFFQIFLRRGQESSKLTDLRNQFGTHNYRAYRISTQEKHSFLLDILSQHRRLSAELHVSQLLEFMIRTRWLDADIRNLTRKIENLEFEKQTGRILSSYVYLSSIHQEMIPILHDYLDLIHRDYYSNNHVVDYGTYMGNTWHYPIHLGIIFASSDDLYTKNRAFKLLQDWQEHDGRLTRVGPHFGLSMDYDQFIIWGAGGLFALLSGLFGGYEKVNKYLIEQLITIIDATRERFKIPNSLWLLHMLPSSEYGSSIYNDYLLPRFSELGAFSLKHFKSPPFLDVDDTFLESFLKKNDNLPTIDVLTKKTAVATSDRSTVIQAACYVLTTDDLSGVNSMIIGALNSA